MIGFNFLDCLFCIINTILVRSAIVDKSDIDDAYLLWTNSDCIDYSFTYARIGMIPGCDQEPIAIKVINNGVISAHYAGDNAQYCELTKPLSLDDKNVETINQIFELLYKELQNPDVYPIIATFNHQFGYPTEAEIGDLINSFEAYILKIYDFTVLSDVQFNMNNIDDAYQLWKNTGNDNYEYTFKEETDDTSGHIVCEIRVKVVNNLVKSVELTGDNKNNCNKKETVDLNDGKTIDQLFEFIENEVDVAFSVSATFDNKYGYPAYVVAYYMSSVEIYGYEYTITDYVAL